MKTPLVLKVRHHGTPKMVGGLLYVDDEIVMFHSERTQSQGGFNDAPGGYDTVVLRWLVEQGIDRVLHRRFDGVVLETSPQMLLDEQIARRHYGDDRYRAFLPESHWTNRGPMWFTEPRWPADEIIFDSEKPPQRPMPKLRLAHLRKGTP